MNFKLNACYQTLLIMIAQAHKCLPDVEQILALHSVVYCKDYIKMGVEIVLSQF